MYCFLKKQVAMETSLNNWHSELNSLQESSFSISQNSVLLMLKKNPKTLKQNHGYIAFIVGRSSASLSVFLRGQRSCGALILEVGKLS